MESHRTFKIGKVPSSAAAGGCMSWPSQIVLALTGKNMLDLKPASGPMDKK